MVKRNTSSYTRDIKPSNSIMGTSKYSAWVDWLEDFLSVETKFCAHSKSSAKKFCDE